RRGAEGDCKEGFSAEIREEHPCLSRGQDVPGRGTSQIIHRERILSQDNKWRRSRLDPRGIERGREISNDQVSTVERSGMEGLSRHRRSEEDLYCSRIVARGRIRQPRRSDAAASKRLGPLPAVKSRIFLRAGCFESTTVATS